MDLDFSFFEHLHFQAFRCGLAGVQTEAQWGYIRQRGSFIIKPEYEGVKAFSEGSAPVKRNGKCSRMPV